MESCVLSLGEKHREMLAAKNRRENPDVAEIVDELRALGIEPKVKYFGPLREETKRALKLEGRAKLD